MKIKKYLEKLYVSAGLLNDRNVKVAVKSLGHLESLLDVGCWTGEKTLEYAKLVNATAIYGIEPVIEAGKQSEKKGIKVLYNLADSQKWQIANNAIDVVISNQVVEHLSDLDFFFKESSRVLKPGGYLITSTNNLSSLHNIFSLLFGWTPFDLTNCSSKSKGIGNPLAVHRGEIDERGSSWTHKCVYTAKWLSDWQLLYGLKVKKVYGAGLYPFPSNLGLIFPKHSAFITLIARKIK
jgi:SAM-dependent methyltransferase